MTNTEFVAFNEQLKETDLVKKTKSKLNEIWDKHQNEFKYLFGLRLFEYAQGKHYDYTTNILPKDLEERTKIINSFRKTNISSSLAKRSQRLTIGYNSLTLNLSPSLCNLSSKAANEKYKDTTSDHIIGVTLCAQYVKYVFQEGKDSKDINWIKLDWLDSQIDFMCNEWLKDNLWLWAQCRITKDEHKPENGLLRKQIKDTISDEVLYRADLEHYKKANIKVLTYRNITP